MTGIIVSIDKVSKWYGQVIGLNEVSLELHPGVVGLLGPNGSGKSTLMKLITGQLRPDKGTVQVFGQSIWNNYPLYRRMGFCPEQDAFYERMTGKQFLVSLAMLQGLGRTLAVQKAEETLERLFLSEAADKKIAGYSKGMRQRVKLGQALLHDPELLLLDEPLTGMDPFGRTKTIRLIRELGKQGKMVLVSSHILHEVELMTNEILLIHQGRILAEGNIHTIRELIDQHPHRIFIRCTEYRRLAADILRFEDIVSARLIPEEGALEVETRQPDHFYSRLPAFLEERSYTVEELSSPDDNLHSVFEYLVK
jgi:ABC-2 type transport system ATP-binding protein